jgi:hypothetical protein
MQLPSYEIVTELVTERDKEMSEELKERNEEIRRLRLEEYWMLEDIGDKFGISRERVRQIIGNTGRDIKAKQTQRIINNPEFDGMEVNEIAKKTGFHPWTIYKYKRFRKTVEEKFWENVEVKSDECWIWKGLIHSNGYGWMRSWKRNDYPHRVSWIIHFGKIPDGHWVKHSCKNKLCVNPNHLYLHDTTT